MSSPPSVPPRPKPRKKRPVDVVSFEDLLAAHTSERIPGQLPPEGVVLIGVDAELQRRMAERIPLPDTAADHTDFGAPNLIGNPPSNIGAPQSNDQNLVAPEQIAAQPRENIEELGAPEIAANPFGAPHFDVRSLIGRPAKRTYTVHPISRLEDAFSPAERELLRWLWDHGRPVSPMDRIRVVIGPNGEGSRRLAAQAGLIYNTFKNLTRALSTKFALDIVKPEKNGSTVYAIYDPPGILDRQRQAGFSGVLHKNGGGRELVDSQIQAATRRPDLTVDELEQIIRASSISAPK
jgi:hypothetical protein